MRQIVAMVALVVCAIPAAAANDARLEECRAKLKQAQKLEVLQGLEWNAPREPNVTAGPTYYRMPFHAKAGFAETVNCFLMAGRSGCLSFDVTHWRTGKTTERFSMCKLKPL